MSFAAILEISLLGIGLQHMQDYGAGAERDELVVV